MTDRTIGEVVDEIVKTADLRARCRATRLRGGSFDRRCTARLELLRAEAEELAAAPAGPRPCSMAQALIDAGTPIKF